MTPHPGTVKIDLPIALPRPRDPLSVEFIEHQKILLDHLGRAAGRNNETPQLDQSGGQS
jgi:NitT/TauT family transport system ATP-binding protein